MRRLALLLPLLACAPRLSSEATRAVDAGLADRAAQPRSDDPDAPRGDLAGLRAIVGPARVVGLGQPGPGGRELQRLHDRLLRLLIDESGFTGLALDVDATAALALDAYVRGAELDLDAALRSLGREHATAELRDTLRWIRRHNAGHEQAVRVFGLDPRDPDAATAVVLAYLERVEPAYVPEARSLLSGGQQIAVDVVLARLDARRRDYLASASADDWSTAKRQAEVVAQARRMAETWEFEAAEFARARHVEWSLAQLGAQGKLVVWAHNRRVAAEVPGNSPVMGDYLRQWLGAEYRAIAGSYAGGAVLVTTDPDLPCAPLPDARAGSLDAALAAAGLPFTLLDLRGNAALRGPLLLASHDGARSEQLRVRPAIAFDAIVGVRRISPATPIAAGPTRPDGRCPTTRNHE